MTAVSWHFKVSEEDLDKVLNDKQMIFVPCQMIFGMVLDSGCSLVNYHTIEISGSQSDCLIE